MHDWLLTFFVQSFKEFEIFWIASLFYDSATVVSG